MPKGKSPPKPSTTPAAKTPPGSTAPCPLKKTGGVVWEKQDGTSDEDFQKAKDQWEAAKKRRLPDGSKPSTVTAMEALEASDKKTTIKVGADGNYEAPDNEADGMNPKKGTGNTIHFNPNKKGEMSDGTVRDPESSIAHEAYHSYQDITGTTPATREQQEVAAAAAENQHRAAKGLPQRKKYGGEWDIPQYTPPAKPK